MNDNRAPGTEVVLLVLLDHVYKYVNVVSSAFLKEIRVSDRICHWRRTTH
jgi:hypothetical protein